MIQEQKKPRIREKDLIAKVYELLRVRYPHTEKRKGFVAWKSPSYMRLRWDIFCIFDIVVALPSGRNVFIQVTTASHLSHRRKKIQAVFEEIGFAIPHSYVYAWDSKREKFKIEKIEMPCRTI